MSDLLSVGLDVGTTTTQLIVSRLQVQNQASSFAVPELQITDRQVIYRSKVHFTPLVGQALVDGDGIRKIVEAEYKNAGITPAQVDTGAVIITGETSRKENARSVLAALAEYAGDFVVATAGPDLESVLAAKGAGAVEFSRNTGKNVLHMDIGGGTSNLAWIENGRIVRTGCMNVGGRLLKFDPAGRVIYVSPVIADLTDLKVGDTPSAGQVEAVANVLAQGLEMVAGLREPTQLLEKLWTEEGTDCHGLLRKPHNDRTSPAASQPPISLGMLATGKHSDFYSLRGAPPFRQGGLGEAAWVISFSGGVADCIDTPRKPGEFGDMGVELGMAIRGSRLCQGDYMLGSQTIRATVIGAGCHSTQLSGSTVFCRNVALPAKNLPVAVFTRQEQDDPALEGIIARRLAASDSDTVVLAFAAAAESYDRLSALAEKIAKGTQGKAVYVCLQADMAKALGQKLCLLLPEETPCLCIDRVQLSEESFLDVGKPVGSAFPVVVKTLVLQSQ